MTAKITASADGLKVTIGNAAEDALEINQTAKTIKGINGYDLIPSGGIAFTGRQAGPASAGFALTVLTDIVAETNIGAAWLPAADRFQPNIAGWYQFNFRVTGQTSAAATFFTARITKNGGGAGNELNQGVAPYASGLFGMPAVSGIFYMNGTTDFVQFLVNASGGAGTLNWSDAMVSAALLTAL
jgi:hypothetical protein